MDGADASTHYDTGTQSQDQAPSLLTIILDTHPAAWALINDTLPLSNAVSALLVFINAHLASNYTKQIAVIASHCDRAQWLYPTPVAQRRANTSVSKGRPNREADADDKINDHNDSNDGEDTVVRPNKRSRQNGSINHNTSSEPNDNSSQDALADTYRPFALIKHAITTNLAALLASTSPQAVQSSTSTKISGALSLALSYIHRLTQQYQEALTGRDGPDFDPSNTGTTGAADAAGAGNMALQSRILLVNLCPSADLAHQYIPIMNNIFACQRLNIPIDVLQLPLALKGGSFDGQIDTKATNTDGAAASTSSVFLQQAADATHGIFIQALFSKRNPSSTQPPRSTRNTATASLLTYLLNSLSSAPHLRPLLTTPKNPNVDFRAACFCHRDIISTGFVCSICLSIFCEQSVSTLIEGGQGCLTCGTQLEVRREGVGGFGAEPVVVSRKKKRSG